MVGWILGLLGQAGNTVAGVANAAAARILALWNFITGYFLRVAGVVGALANVVRAWLAAHLASLVATLTTLRWLIGQLIPSMLAQLRDQLIRWVSGVLALAVGELKALINGVRAFATTAVTLLQAYIQSTVVRVFLAIASAQARLTRIERYLFGVLGSPDRIATYIVDAMACALEQWAKDNAVRVGRIALRILLRNVGGVVGSVEDIITRII